LNVPIIGVTQSPPLVQFLVVPGPAEYTFRVAVTVFILVIIGCLVLAALYFDYKKKHGQQNKLPPGYDSVMIKGNGKYQLEVVGESFYQGALEEICGPRTDKGVEKDAIATMIWEDDNPKDPLAVRIDIDGKAVGYLSRPFARLVRETVAEHGYTGIPVCCNAIIRGGWDRGERGKGNYGVRLDFPQYDSRKGERL